MALLLKEATERELLEILPSLNGLDRESAAAVARLARENAEFTTDDLVRKTNVPVHIWRARELEGALVLPDTDVRDLIRRLASRIEQGDKSTPARQSVNHGRMIDVQQQAISPRHVQRWGPRGNWSAGWSAGFKMDKTFRLKNGTDLVVRVGELTATPTGAIVNPTSGTLQHDQAGGIAVAIKQAAGSRQFQADSDYIVRDHGPLQEGDVEPQRALNLPCQWVINTVPPKPYSFRSKEGVENAWINMLYNILECAAQWCRVKELALPIIGAEPGALTIDGMAQTLCYVLEQFESHIPSGQLTRIELVDISQDDIRVVCRALARRWGPPINNSQMEPTWSPEDLTPWWLSPGGTLKTGSPSFMFQQQPTAGSETRARKAWFNKPGYRVMLSGIEKDDVRTRGMIHQNRPETVPAFNIEDLEDRSCVPEEGSMSTLQWRDSLVHPQGNAKGTPTGSRWFQHDDINASTDSSTMKVECQAPIEARSTDLRPTEPEMPHLRQTEAVTENSASTQSPTDCHFEDSDERLPGTDEATNLDDKEHSDNSDSYMRNVPAQPGTAAECITDIQEEEYQHSPDARLKELNSESSGSQMNPLCPASEILTDSQSQLAKEEKALALALAGSTEASQPTPPVLQNSQEKTLSMKADQQREGAGGLLSLGTGQAGDVTKTPDDKSQVDLACPALGISTGSQSQLANKEKALELALAGSTAASQSTPPVLKNSQEKTLAWQVDQQPDGEGAPLSLGTGQKEDDIKTTDHKGQMDLACPAFEISIDSQSHLVNEEKALALALGESIPPVLQNSQGKTLAGQVDQQPDAEGAPLSLGTGQTDEVIKTPDEGQVDLPCPALEISTDSQFQLANEEKSLALALAGSTEASQSPSQKLQAKYEETLTMGIDQRPDDRGDPRSFAARRKEDFGENSECESQTDLGRPALETVSDNQSQLVSERWTLAMDVTGTTCTSLSLPSHRYSKEEFFIVGNDKPSDGEEDPLSPTTPAKPLHDCQLRLALRGQEKEPGHQQKERLLKEHCSSLPELPSTRSGIPTVIPTSTGPNDMNQKSPDKEPGHQPKEKASEEEGKGMANKPSIGPGIPTRIPTSTGPKDMNPKGPDKEQGHQPKEKASEEAGRSMANQPLTGSGTSSGIQIPAVSKGLCQKDPEKELGLQLKKIWEEGDLQNKSPGSYLSRTGTHRCVPIFEVVEKSLKGPENDAGTQLNEKPSDEECMSQPTGENANQAKASERTEGAEATMICPGIEGVGVSLVGPSCDDTAQIEMCHSSNEDRAACITPYCHIPLDEPDDRGSKSSKSWLTPGEMEKGNVGTGARFHPLSKRIPPDKVGSEFTAAEGSGRHAECQEQEDAGNDTIKRPLQHRYLQGRSETCPGVIITRCGRVYYTPKHRDM